MTTSVRLVILTAMAASLAAAHNRSTMRRYKAKVEPIFLKKREGHARCVVCHAGAGNAFRLQPLAPGRDHLDRRAVAAKLRSRLQAGERGESDVQPAS